MSEDKLAELFSVADSVAKRLAYNYEHVDAEDIAQELRLYVLEKIDTLRTFYESSANSNPYKLLYWHGESYCITEINESSIVVSNMSYSTNDVRIILETALKVQERINTMVPEGSRSYRPKKNRRPGSNPMAEWDAVCIASDISAHMRCLSEEDQQILFDRYVLGDDSYIESSTVRMRISRAIERLTTELNNFARDKSKWQAARPNGYIGSRAFVDTVPSDADPEDDDDD